MKERIIISNCPQFEYFKCNYHKDMFGDKINCSDITCDVKNQIRKHGKKLSKIYKELGEKIK